MRSHILTILDNPHLSACFSFSPSSLVPYSLRKDIQFGVLGIICSICAPSSLSLSGYFKLQSEGISNPDQIVFGVSLFKFFKASWGVLLPTPPDHPNRYEWNNLHHSRSIEIIFRFAFLCLRKLWKDVQEINNNGRSK